MTLPAYYGRITFRNILTATDFSATAERALAYAVAIARHYGAKMYVGHVTQAEVYLFGPPSALPRTLAEINAEAEQGLKVLVSSISLSDVRLEPLLRHGDVIEVLMEWSREYEVDLLVLGTHGRRGIRKLIMGSVMEEIIRLAGCPVLVVGPRSTVKPAALDLKRILYATDFSEESLQALPIALSLGQEFEAHTVLAHVVPNPIDDLATRQRIEWTSTERLRRLVPEEVSVWLEQEHQVKFGSALDGILTTARDRNFDLIVIGARGIGAARNPSRRLGATAESLASCSTCPVLTVRTLGSAGTDAAGKATEESAA